MSAERPGVGEPLRSREAVNPGGAVLAEQPKGLAY